MYDPKTINYMNNVYLPQRMGGYRATHCVNTKQIENLMRSQRKFN